MAVHHCKALPLRSFALRCAFSVWKLCLTVRSLFHACARPFQCWFTSHTLFKVHSTFTRSSKANEAWEARATRFRDRAEREEADEERKERMGITSARRANPGLVAAAVSSEKRVVGGGKKRSEEEAEAEADASFETWLNDRVKREDEEEETNDLFNQRVGALSRERCRRMRIELGKEGTSNELRAERNRLHREGNIEGARMAHRKYVKQAGKEGASLTFFTAHNQGKAAVRLRPSAGAPPFQPPPRAGIHAFIFDPRHRLRRVDERSGGLKDGGLGGGTSASFHCQGEGAPVVLHYPNATQDYWLKKYEMLTVDANSLFEAGVKEGDEVSKGQISLKGMAKLQTRLVKLFAKFKKEKEEKERQEGQKAQKVAEDGGSRGTATVAAEAAAAESEADGEEDEDDGGAAAALEEADSKKGTSQGMHHLAAALVSLGESEMARKLFQQQFAVVDMLPCLAANGLLVEINQVRDLILEVSAEHREAEERKRDVEATEEAEAEADKAAEAAVDVAQQAAAGDESSSKPI